MRYVRGALALLLAGAWACSTGSSALQPIVDPTATAPSTTTPPAAIAPKPTAKAPSGWPAPPPRAVRGRVTRVVDGDTVVIAGISLGTLDSGGRPGRYARLIGVDTPEVYGGADCYGVQASAFTRRHLAGRNVFVDFDVDPVDRYGRALIYIWTTDGVFFNAFIAAQGFAQQMTVPPNVRYADLFTRYVREARENRRGLWSAC